MPYVLTLANHKDWSVEEDDAATRAVVGPFKSDEERKIARLRYDAVMQAKRDSGWQLPTGA